MGTYIHGIFDNYIFRKSFLDYLCEKKGISARQDIQVTFQERMERTYERLAAVTRESLDMEAIYKIMGIKM